MEHEKPGVDLSSQVLHLMSEIVHSTATLRNQSPSHTGTIQMIANVQSVHVTRDQEEYFQFREIAKEPPPRRQRLAWQQGGEDGVGAG